MVCPLHFLPGLSKTPFCLDSAITRHKPIKLGTIVYQYYVYVKFNRFFRVVVHRCAQTKRI